MLTRISVSSFRPAVNVHPSASEFNGWFCFSRRGGRASEASSSRLDLHQESGHAMQDFARLEVEIKFALMDRQQDTSQEELPGLDLTPSQAPLWQKMEDHLLLSEKWKEPKQSWPKKGFKRNVGQCLKWVQMVRRKAEEVGGQCPVPGGHPHFFDEYLPALFYHTLQAIGWPSLSIFKRLLAVYSAASILDKLEELGEAALTKT